MRKRSLPKIKSTPKIKRERDPLPWRYCLLTLICGVLLVGGFFFAGRQHFSSIEFGIKNSKLKKQLEEIEAEKRRLILEKEIALTPSEIKKAAKKLGLTEITAANIEAYQPNQSKKDKTDKPESKQSPEAKSKPLVSSILENNEAKSEKNPKQPRKIETFSDTKEKSLSKTGK